MEGPGMTKKQEAIERVTRMAEKYEYDAEIANTTEEAIFFGQRAADLRLILSACEAGEDRATARSSHAAALAPGAQVAGADAKVAPVVSGVDQNCHRSGGMQTPEISRIGLWNALCERGVSQDAAILTIELAVEASANLQPVQKSKP
jgi:hypothetical protein